MNEEMLKEGAVKYGNAVREAREAMKPELTQTQMAYNIGISRGYLCRIENGKEYPDLKVQMKIAYELGKDPNELTKEIKFDFTKHIILT